MSGVQETNLALARAIGLEVKGKHVTGFDLRVRHDEIPRLTVHGKIIDRLGIDEYSSTFEIVRVDEPFDLDRACARANERIREFVDRAADAALTRLESSRPRVPTLVDAIGTMRARKEAHSMVLRLDVDATDFERGMRRAAAAMNEFGRAADRVRLQT